MIASDALSTDSVEADFCIEAVEKALARHGNQGGKPLKKPLEPVQTNRTSPMRGTAATQDLDDMTPGSHFKQLLANAAAVFFAPENEKYRSWISAWADAQQTKQVI
ncbi:hypothetical protein [Loktanella sp. M215]|uniref:hypothetical protein n=1 Tax=Loktanella sp. M215 TaxID=2675431 RepID=UPI001F232869|nr:hypothetical protein [Loktanella sp. M215]MCF7699839.1 hypothetical protein [Loktanella sp. M215]